MMKNDQDKDNLDFEQQYPGLTSQQKELLQMFGEQDREIIYAAIINSSTPDELSFDSLTLALDEIKAMGSCGSSLLSVARTNFELNEQLRKERKLTIISLAALALSVTLIGVLIYLFSVYPKYKTVQTVDNSVICQIDPENNPLLTDASIQDFAKNAVLNAYSFDYINYRDHLNNTTTHYFTSDGRAAFHKALQESGSLSYIIKNALVMRSMALNVPQIEEKGRKNDGTAYWIVRMPITTEFYSGGSTPADKQNFVAEAKLVTTQKDAFNPKGLGVYSLILKPYKPQQQ